MGTGSLGGRKAGRQINKERWGARAARERGENSKYHVQKWKDFLMVEEEVMSVERRANQTEIMLVGANGLNDHRYRG